MSKVTCNLTHLTPGDTDGANILYDALTGNRGKDQQRIAETIVDWGSLLLRKNADYGSGIWKPPILAPECEIGTAIRVRMSDKIARLNQLLSGNNPQVNESIDDTLRDLGAYCLLLLAAPKE